MAFCHIRHSFIDEMVKTFACEMVGFPLDNATVLLRKSSFNLNNLQMVQSSLPRVIISSPSSKSSQISFNTRQTRKIRGQATADTAATETYYITGF